WRPIAIDLPPDALRRFYQSVPGPLPPLYERLIGSYHFALVELESFWLLPNFPPALDGLAKAMKSDTVMFRVLTSNGFVQFGRAPQYNYDPLCFDLNARLTEGDCPI